MAYNPQSSIATEFINHEEILDTLEYARQHKDDRVLISSLIEKARECRGLRIAKRQCCSNATCRI